MLAGEAPFDIIAPDYDFRFSKSLIGEQQRGSTRQWLLQFLNDKESLNILEINCGTGDDALWLASLGHFVTATDQSQRMIEQANRKIYHCSHPHKVRFVLCDFRELDSIFHEKEYDLIFSNFSGLNCVSPAELEQIADNLSSLLKPSGHLAAVIFGKYCIWETIYFLAKGKLKNAFQRWRRKPVMIKLKGQNQQPVYYYSSGMFSRIFKAFRLQQKKPVGLFIPPSYLESAMQRRPRFFKFLTGLENRFTNSGFSQFADHTYFLLKKKK